jgi:sortase (surface protein transpeptidase)
MGNILFLEAAPDNLVKVWSISGGKEVASLAGHAVTTRRMLFGRSPSVQMGDILFLEVRTTW